MTTLGMKQPDLARSSSKSRGRKRGSSMLMSYDDFLQADLGHHHFEWVAGKVIEMSPVESGHARLAGFLYFLLTAWLDANGGGEVFQDPFQMRLNSRPSGRAPDLQVVLPKNLPQVKRVYLDGPADVVIEIISTGSRSTDRRDKFSEYQDAGVPEYWLIDPLRRQAEFYILEKGRFFPAEIDDEHYFHSRQLPGVWLDTEWLWKLPTKASILKKWKVNLR